MPATTPPTFFLVAAASCSLLCAAGAINPGGFPNSVTGPLRGWRSWNAVFSDITQSFTTRQVVAIAQRRHSIDGKPTSLLDLGYSRVGIDSGWASCSGVNGSWHDETGHFIINKTSFPDMKAMTDHAHSLGVKMGFYLNQDLDPGYHMCKSEGQIHGAACNTGNCRSYRLDAEDTAKLGFDGVKFDAGGGNDNMTLWAEAINATGREMVLENCNNGGDVPYGARHGLEEGCPFNMFRTGIDNAPSPLSMVSNLLDASRYFNVSKPGCWAYPDMLELGAPVVGKYAASSPRNGPTGPPRESNCSDHDGTVGDTQPRLSFAQAQAEFAAWCTVSAPLILGFDLGNTTEYDTWWPIVSNTRALAIQADFAGVAGRLLGTGPLFSTRVPHGASCEDMKDSRDLPSWSVWGKPLSGGRWAITAINSLLTTTAEIAVDFSELHGLLLPPPTPPCEGEGECDSEGTAVTVTEVWGGKVTRLPAGATSWTTTLGKQGHAFVVLGPLEPSAR